MTDKSLGQQAIDCELIQTGFTDLVNAGEIPVDSVETRTAFYASIYWFLGFQANIAQQTNHEEFQAMHESVVQEITFLKQLEPEEIEASIKK